jgi:hypothetical protein
MSSYSLFNLVKDFICNYTGVIVNRVNSRPLGSGRLYCQFNTSYSPRIIIVGRFLMRVLFFGGFDK